MLIPGTDCLIVLQISRLKDTAKCCCLRIPPTLALIGVVISERQRVARSSLLYAMRESSRSQQTMLLPGLGQTVI